MIHEVITNVSQEIILKVMNFFSEITFLPCVHLIGITCQNPTKHDRIINNEVLLITF